MDQNSLFAVLDQPRDQNFHYAFQAQTDARYEVEIVVVNRKKHTLPISQILHILGASMNGIPTMVDRHGGIQEA